MSPRELAEALRDAVLPDNAVMGRLLAAGEYEAIVLDTMERAATHRIAVDPALLGAVDDALAAGVFETAPCDAEDAANLRADLEAVRQALGETTVGRPGGE